MPSPNIVKDYMYKTVYHVYNRGVNKEIIFNDDKDYNYFINLLKRYLDNKIHMKSYGGRYEKFNKRIEILAFCLMPNHYHLLIYQKDKSAMSQLMQRIMTAYSMYYNVRHSRIGNLFQDRYKAKRINKDSYYLHISRYIHLNPKELSGVNYKKYNYSSYRFYANNSSSSWLKPKRILKLFNNHKHYLKFVSDYEPNFKKTFF